MMRASAKTGARAGAWAIGALVALAGLPAGALYGASSAGTPAGSDGRTTPERPREVMIGATTPAELVGDAAKQERVEKARAMAERASAWLRTRQDAGGGWGVREGAPVFPAISSLVLMGLLDEPGAAREQLLQDPAVARGVAFVIGKQQPDGGIYDRLLASYNTAISVSMLARVPTPEARDAVKKGAEFLKGLQYGEGASEREGDPESPRRVAREHPFYGGWGYGRHGRPDLSNSAFAIEALADAGVDREDPAMQRALVFLQRIQMLERAEIPADEAAGTPARTFIVNDAPYAKGSRQGGFIYATSENRENVGSGQSFAGMIDETLSDGTVASRLRAYGSMTYSGFKSYLYAGLSPRDPRVTAALGWIGANYTVEENPGLGTDGLYYYYVVFSRALEASGLETVPRHEGAQPGDRSGDRSHQNQSQGHDWRADLVERLATLQNDDGSFRSVDDRWMENDPVLITAYALIALRHAAGDARGPERGTPAR